MSNEKIQSKTHTLETTARWRKVRTAEDVGRTYTAEEVVRGCALIDALIAADKALRGAP